MITQRVFGKTKEGREVLAFTLQDGASAATILNYGGILQALVLPDRNGTPTDVILGYNEVALYEQNDGYLGALIGRFGNRIDKGRLTIDGKTYSLYCNDKSNHLHGGRVGFNQKIWAHEIEGNRLILTILSPDGEENYPGNLRVRVTYSFVAGALKIEYYAVADKKTAISLTNHAYFNLDGEGSGDAKGNLLRIDSGQIVPTDEELIPHGGFKAVKGTPFDFNDRKAIGEDIAKEDIDLLRGSGYDHCYLLKSERGRAVEYAQAVGAKTGIRMRCYTDMPAVHFYSGNFLNQQGKSTYYGKNAGFCLETEAVPNNVNVEEYASLGSSIYDAGEEYAFSATYQFDIEQ